MRRSRWNRDLLFRFWICFLLLGIIGGRGGAKKISWEVAQNTATFAQMRPMVVAGVTYRNFARSNKNAHRG